MHSYFKLLGVVKRNPLFLHEIEKWKNNEFLFTTPNILSYNGVTVNC